MRRPTVTAAAFLAALAAAMGGYFLIPGEAEKLTMLVRDGHEQLALEHVNALIARGARDPKLLMQAFMLNLRAGEEERAAAVLERYFAQRPDDAAAWRRAAEAFAATGQAERQREALEHVVRLTRDAEAAGALSAIYRFRGEEEEELRVLSLVEAEKLRAGDAIRLARLLAARGRPGEVVKVLAPRDRDEAGLTAEDRILLFTALIEERRFGEAVERALAWQQDEDGGALADVFVGYLLRAGAEEEALRLAMGSDPLADPQSMAHAARLFLDEGRTDLSERLVRQWLAEARALPPDRLDRVLAEIVAIADARGAGMRLFPELFATLKETAPPAVQAAFVAAVHDRLGHAGIAPFRAAIGPQILAARPVLAARLFSEERNHLLARHFLLTTDLMAEPAAARAEWLALARRILAPRELALELERRALAGAIPRPMQQAVLQAVLGTGSRPQAMAVWQAFFGSPRPAVGEEDVAARDAASLIDRLAAAAARLEGAID